MKSIFVSYVFEDKPWFNKMKKWEQKGLLDNHTLITETKGIRPDGKNVINKHLKTRIEGAAIILVLIGNNTHNHDWIKIEVEFANNFNKTICGMRIPNTTGKKPAILKSYSELEFNPNQILKTLPK